MDLAGGLRRRVQRRRVGPGVSAGRYLEPGTGQFLSRDPLAASTREAYAYVGGSPLNYIDPSGLDWLGEEYGGGWGYSDRSCPDPIAELAETNVAVRDLVRLVETGASITFAGLSWDTRVGRGTSQPGRTDGTGNESPPSGAESI